MKQKSLKLAGMSLAAAALFGTGCDIFGGGGGGGGGTTPSSVSLAGKVLLSLTHYQYNANTDQFRQTATEHVVVGTDGSVNRLNRNDARDRQLVNVLSCPNGNAILRTTGGNNTYYFFDAQKNEIRFLAWTNAGSTVLANDNREPIGIMSDGGAGELVAYCNGQFVALGNTANTYVSNPNWNTIVGYDTNDHVVYSIKYPNDLKGNFTVDSNNLMSSQNVGSGNVLSTVLGAPVMATTNNWAIFVEQDSNADLVALIFVNLMDGSIKRVAMQNPVALKGGANQHAAPAVISAVEENNDVYIAIAPAPGTTDPRIWYGKFNGNQLSTILTVDPDGGATNETLFDVALDGKGNLYFIDSNANKVLSYATPASNQVTDLPAVANAYTNVWFGNVSYILPLPEGVLLAHGNPANYVSYKPGDNNVTAINSNNDPEVVICDKGTILSSGDRNVVCIDRSRGQGELAYIPSVDTNTWQVANPDSLPTNNNLQLFNAFGNNTPGVIYGQDVFVRTNEFWYKCSLGNQVSCSRLTNVTARDLPNFSLLPVPLQTPAGYISIIDLIGDRVSSFVWSYPALANPAVISGDGKKLANAYSSPDSLCDLQNAANVLVTEELGNSPIDYVLFNDTDLNPDTGKVVKPFTCISGVLHTW